MSLYFFTVLGRLAALILTLPAGTADGTFGTATFGMPLTGVFGIPVRGVFGIPVTGVLGIPSFCVAPPTTPFTFLTAPPAPFVTAVFGLDAAEIVVLPAGNAFTPPPTVPATAFGFVAEIALPGAGPTRAAFEELAGSAFFVYALPFVLTAAAPPGGGFTVATFLLLFTGGVPVGAVALMTLSP